MGRCLVISASAAPLQLASARLLGSRRESLCMDYGSGMWPSRSRDWCSQPAGWALPSFQRWPHVPGEGGWELPQPQQ